MEGETSGAYLAFDAATAEPANSDAENHVSRNDDPTSSGADDTDEGARNSSPTSDPETSVPAMAAIHSVCATRTAERRSDRRET